MTAEEKAGEGDFLHLSEGIFLFSQIEVLLCLPFVPYLLQIADELGFLGDCGEAVMVLLVGWFFASAAFAFRSFWAQFVAEFEALELEGSEAATILLVLPLVNFSLLTLSLHALHLCHIAPSLAQGEGTTLIAASSLAGVVVELYFLWRTGRWIRSSVSGCLRADPARYERIQRIRTLARLRMGTNE